MWPSLQSWPGKPHLLFSHNVLLFSAQSLAGHTTPVESVRFGHNEEMIVAGSMSGALKIWDLEEAKSKS